MRLRLRLQEFRVEGLGAQGLRGFGLGDLRVLDLRFLCLEASGSGLIGRQNVENELVQWFGSWACCCSLGSFPHALRVYNMGHIRATYTKAHYGTGGIFITRMLSGKEAVLRSMAAQR